MGRSAALATLSQHLGHARIIIRVRLAEALHLTLLHGLIGLAELQRKTAHRFVVLVILTGAPASAGDTPAMLLSVRGLVKRFPLHKGVLAQVAGYVHAVEGLDLDLAAGEAVGLVGESGCGKTTAGRCLLRLIEPTAGSILVDGVDLMSLSAGALRQQRRHLQMIFQDPYGSLNPRMTVGDILTEPLVVHGLCSADDARDHAVALLERVGLERSDLDRWPHQFSGGQRQRIGIARALSVEPRLIVCDEAVSALDVSVQAQVLNLLSDVQRERNLAYLFISHDLNVVAHLCTRVAVMYLGEIVEMGPVQRLFEHPLHPYTQALLSAVPGLRRGKRIVLPGEPPSPLEPPSAARMIRRFPHHAAAFRDGDMRLQQAGDGHVVRCARLDVLQELAAKGEAAWV